MNSLLRTCLGVSLLATPLLAQSVTQTRLGGFPSSGVPTLIPINTHVQPLQGAAVENRSLDIPLFDPSLGTLRDATVEFRATTALGPVSFRSNNTSLGGRSVSLSGVTNIIFQDSTLGDPSAGTGTNMGGTLPPFRRDLTFSPAAVNTSPVVVSVPAASLGAWQGNGNRRIGLLLQYAYSGSFAAQASVTWRPALNVQARVTYTYDRFPDGVSIRGVPGCGFSSISFTPFNSGQYVIETSSSVNPTYRSGEMLPLGDDTSVDRSLPFAFEMPDGRVINQLRIHSNGFLSDPTSNLSNSPFPTPFELVGAGGPIIAPCWVDLAPNEGGAVWFKADSRSIVVTWENVPEYQTGNSNTFQVELFPGGRTSFAYADMDIRTPSPLVGMAEGNVTNVPAPQDLSAIAAAGVGLLFPRTVYESFDNSNAFDANTNQSLPVLAGVTPPNLGTNYQLVLQNAPNALNAALFVSTQGRVSLETLLPGFGFGDCMIRVEFNSATIVPMPTSGNLAIPIPNDAGLRGFGFEFQALTADPTLGTNFLGIGVSNALSATVGG